MDLDPTIFNPQMFATIFYFGAWATLATYMAYNIFRKAE